jgi:type II secretory pathway predicted ATPase ExeA
MYKTFFNLARNPFDLVPDPALFFATKQHNEALATLYHGVRRHKGFIVLTGEVGTGKTLLLRSLLQLFKASNDVAYAYLFNSRLSPMEFMQYIVSDFGLPASGQNKTELLLKLTNYVVSRGLRKLTTVLVVDEAHNVSADILEEIRLLTNLETTEEKLLQVLLVGQPELDEKLDSFGLRPLKQRIALRARLEPLNPSETKDYVEWRLQRAGANSSAGTLFTAETVAALYFHSRGFPRLINMICENALITAYARGLHSVPPSIIHDIAKDFRLEVQAAELDPESKENDEMNIVRAVKIMLDFYSTLHKLAVTDKLQVAVSNTDGTKHEQYI